MLTSFQKVEQIPRQLFISPDIRAESLERPFETSVKRTNEHQTVFGRLLPTSFTLHVYLAVAKIWG